MSDTGDFNVTNESITVDEMRKSREMAVVAYTEFTQDSEHHNTHLFCFYEGEDGKYYDTLIRKYYSNFFTYCAGCKSEVLKALKIISGHSEYNEVNKMFFIDRDFDDSLAGTHQDLYETPCYSIENLYVKEKCFIQILQSEFSLNPSNPDFVKCLSDYRKRFDEFHNIIIDFNVMLFLRNKKSISNSIYKFSTVSTSSCVDISIFGVTPTAKYEAILSEIKTMLSFTDDEIEKAKLKLTDIGNYENIFRGKNELDFFTCILTSLKSANKSETYFSRKIDRVRINITNNRLSELSQYAIMPDCLDTFLKSHVR